MGLCARIKEFFAGKDEKSLLSNNSVVVDNDKTINSRDPIGNLKTKSGNNEVGNNSPVNNFYGPVYNFSDIKIGSPEFQQVQQELLREFNNGDAQFVERQSDRQIIGYQDFVKNSDYIKTIEFFTDKISVADLQFLRTGLYVRYLSDNSHKDESLRVRDSAIRNNQRARNIINLASAGYFESYIQPIYENNQEFFKEDYEEVVEYLPEVIFVNNSMTPAKILKEIGNKIAQKQQYHLQVRRITINGLGQTVDIIKKSESQIRGEYPDYKMNLQIDGSNTTLLRAKMRIELE